MYDARAVRFYEKGRALHLDGKLPEAERAYKKALKFSQDFFEAHNNLGNVLLDRGRIREASNAYRKALDLHPDHPMLLNNLGNALQLLGDNEKAIALLEHAIAREPNYADALSNLGNAQRGLGSLELALSSYQRALAIDPGQADIYNNLGGVMVELEMLDEAVDIFSRALDINPGNMGARIGLGNAYCYRGDLAAGITAFRKALAIDPSSLEACRALAAALGEQGDLQGAIEAYNRALEIDPANAQIHADLGRMFSDHGEIDEAACCFRKAIAIAPDHAEAYRLLSKNRTFAERDDDLRSMETRYRAKRVSAGQKMHLAFGLGKAYEDLGEYDKSIDMVLEANRLKRESLDYSIDRSKRLFARIKQLFPASIFSANEGGGHPDRTPVFIVGMPRSGSSLAEQILASHPDVFGAGELADLRLLVRSIASGDTAGDSADFPARIADLAASDFEELGKAYVAGIRRFSVSAKRITDKMPHNFLRIGFIRLILPNARIIHCTRDPVDTCLSILKNYFADEHAYAWDMTELGQYYGLYVDLMRYWDQLLPGFIHDLNYERLVADPETQIGKLLDFCDLGWSDSCLMFHQTRRKVNTASNAQVRRPLYNDSVKLWKRYENRLQPLLESIGR